MTASAAQLHVLALAKAGRDCTYVPLVNGKGCQSRTVGRGATVSFCHHKGWIVWNPDLGRGGLYELTDAGRAILDADAAREQARKDQTLRNNVLNDAGWEKGYRAHGLWTCSSRYASDWHPGWNGFRLGLVTLGPPRFWDGTYSWLINKPGDTDVTLAQGTAPTLKAAKDAVVMGVARRLYGLETA